MNGHSDTTRLFLQLGANINETNVYRSPPLHVVIKQRFESPPEVADDMYRVSRILQLLVDAGAHVEMSDDEGRTPIHLAAQMADEASIRVLLDSGANGKAEDSEGLLPLDHAAESHSLEVFSLLFKRWADVMAESSEDAVESWLQLAPKKARGASVELLRDWRRLSLEDLIELTSDCEVKENWTKRGPERFSSWFRARQIRRKSQYE